MSTVTYNYTITDASWYDARPLMANWLKLRDEINGNLDQDNIKAASAYSWARLVVTDGFEADQIAPASNIAVSLIQDGSWWCRTAALTDIMVVNADGVALG